MSKFLISWQETYEMSSVVEASTLEEALGKAARLIDDTPSFEFMDEWQSGPEGAPVTTTQSENVEAECLFSTGPFCVPYIAREAEDDQEEDADDAVSEIPWPSKGRPVGQRDGSH